VYQSLERYRWLIVAALAAPLLIALGFFLHDRLSGPEPLEIDLGDVPASEVRVYISGAVQRPGVYTINDGDRWIDVLELAGGPSADANVAAVNLSQRAYDEDHVYIPRIGEAAGSAGSGQPVGSLIDINTASQALLETLPGIGEVRASDIVASRTTTGPFVTTEELVSRDIIPQSVYADIVNMITVGP